MPEDLTFAALSQRLNLRELPIAEPSADLWPRIVAQQARRRRSARRLSIGLCCVGVAAAAAVVVLAAALEWRQHVPLPGSVDWQARAQALELELRAADAKRGPLPVDALSELARVDAALQAAYDDGADRARVGLLWKQRSELLSALLRARRENVEISRI